MPADLVNIVQHRAALKRAERRLCAGIEQPRALVGVVVPRLEQQIEHTVVVKDVRTHEVVLAAPALLPLVDPAPLRPVDHIGRGVHRERIVADDLADVEVIHAVVVKHIRVCAVADRVDKGFARICLARAGHGEVLRFAAIAEDAEPPGGRAVFCKLDQRVEVVARLVAVVPDRNDPAAHTGAQAAEIIRDRHMPLTEPDKRAVPDGVQHHGLLGAVYFGGKAVFRIAHTEIKEHTALAADVRRKVGGTAEVCGREDRPRHERAVGHGRVRRGGKRKPRQRDAAAHRGHDIVLVDADAEIVEAALCRVSAAQADRVRKRRVDHLVFGRLQAVGHGKQLARAALRLDREQDLALCGIDHGREADVLLVKGVKPGAQRVAPAAFFVEIGEHALRAACRDRRGIAEEVGRRRREALSVRADQQAAHAALPEVVHLKFVLFAAVFLRNFVGQAARRGFARREICGAVFHRPVAAHGKVGEGGRAVEAVLVDDDLSGRCRKAQQKRERRRAQKFCNQFHVGFLRVFSYFNHSIRRPASKYKKYAVSGGLFAGSKGRARHLFGSPVGEELYETQSVFWLPPWGKLSTELTDEG